MSEKGVLTRMIEEQEAALALYEGQIAICRLTLTDLESTVDCLKESLRKMKTRLQTAKEKSAA